MAGWTVTNLQQFLQARVVKAAAGQSKGKAAFSECDIVHSAFSGQGTDREERIGQQYEVEVTTIDEALLKDERPDDLIKCDAEGSEMLVLRGALIFLVSISRFYYWNPKCRTMPSSVLGLKSSKSCSAQWDTGVCHLIMMPTDQFYS